MTLDERLREAAQEARSAVARLSAPDAQRARRARWRSPVTAVATAAALVLVVVGLGALLRDGGPSPTTVAPAVTESTTPELAVPPGAVEVPIGGADPERVAEARAFAIENGTVEPVLVGQVDDTVLFSTDGDGGSRCLVAVGAPGGEWPMTSVCNVDPLQLVPDLSMSPLLGDDAVIFAGAVMGQLAPQAAMVVVTVGDTAVAQRPLDGYVFLPFEAAAGTPAEAETLAADGRRVAVSGVVSHIDIIRGLLDLRVAREAEHLAESGGYEPADVETLERRLAVLGAAARDAGGDPELEARLAAVRERLAMLRAELRADVPPAGEGPIVTPATPDLTAALEGSLVLAASPDGVLWFSGGRADSPEPSSVFAVDGATGGVLARYDVGLPMQQLAPGLGRVWFGRTADGALPTSAVGYVDRATGEVVIVETDLGVGSLILADGSGASAYVLSGEPGRPIIARVGPQAEPAPLAVEIDANWLVTGLAWEGGLLVADDARGLWFVDTSTETATEFADLGTGAFALGEAVVVGGEPAVWALTWTGTEVRALLVDGDGELVADHPLPRSTLDLVSGGGDQALALTQSGDVWSFGPTAPPERVARVDPGSPDEGFTGMARAGRSLWLTGGVASPYRLDFGQ